MHIHNKSWCCLLSMVETKCLHLSSNIKIVACDTVESASCNMTAGRLFPQPPRPEQPVNSLLSLSMNILNLNTQTSRRNFSWTFFIPTHRWCNQSPLQENYRPICCAASSTSIHLKQEHPLLFPTPTHTHMLGMWYFVLLQTLRRHLYLYIIGLEKPKDGKSSHCCL